MRDIGGRDCTKRDCGAGEGGYLGRGSARRITHGLSLDIKRKEEVQSEERGRVKELYRRATDASHLYGWRGFIAAFVAAAVQVKVHGRAGA